MNTIDIIFQKLDEVSTGKLELIELYRYYWQKISYVKKNDGIKLLDGISKLPDASPIGLARLTFSHGVNLQFASEFIDSIDTLSRAREMFIELEEYGGAMSCHTMMGISYRSLGQLDKAQEHNQAALKILSEHADSGIYTHFELIAYYQAGELNVHFKNYAKAIEYLKDGINKEAGNEDIKGRLYNGLGCAIMFTPEWESSLEHFNKALKLIEGFDNFLLRSKIYADIGSYYLKKGQLDKAFENQKKSLDLRIENNFLNPAITNYVQLAEICMEQKNAEEAIRYGNLALEAAMKLNVLIKILEAHLILSKTHESIGNTTKAYEHFKQYHHYYKEINSQEVIKRIEQVTTKHKMESVQQEKEIFRLRNVELKAALEEITASVRYAKRIQKAILPPEHQLKKYFPESFILYKPKDIVAGDFYWMDVVGNSVFFAICDCTGHGVPGALLSVVCHNALTRAVREFQETVPSKILDRTRELVIAQFEKTEDDVKDGMDCVIWSIDLNTLELQYAAANNSFYVIRNNELLIQQPDKMPVGKFVDDVKYFTPQRIQLYRGDQVFTFTDGYADQFGGPNGKKFKYKQLQEKLMGINALQMSTQKEVLEETIETWKGNLEQVDDVLIMGIRV